MSTVSIRKTKLPYKGGPGAVGVRFDPKDSRLKIHDGTSETVVAEGVKAAAIASPTGGATVDAESRTAIDAIRAALTAFGITA